MSREIVALAAIIFSVFGAGAVSADVEGDALKDLMALSAVKVPQENVHCEINGAEGERAGTTVYGAMTVGDFAVSYAAWSLKRRRTSRDSFTCDGEGPVTCTWSFGEQKRSEGWNRILRFDYDPAARRVRRESLTCMDVP